MSGAPAAAEPRPRRAALPEGGPFAEGFRSVFDAELAYVCHSLRRLGVREGDLEDVAQDLFVAVHARFSEYDRARPIRPWLFSFACRVAANYRRLARHRREVARPDADEGATSLPDPEQSAERSEKRELLLEALETIDFDRRAAFIMHDLDGFTAAQIAEVVGAPENTIHSRVRLARIEMKQAVLAIRRRGGLA